MTQGEHEVRMPVEQRLLNWTNQDTIDTIMGEGEEEEEGEIQNYLRNAGAQELYGIAMMAARKTGGTRHLTEAIVEEIVEVTREELRLIARGDAAPPRMDTPGPGGREPVPAGPEPAGGQHQGDGPAAPRRRTDQGDAPAGAPRGPGGPRPSPGVRPGRDEAADRPAQVPNDQEGHGRAGSPTAGRNGLIGGPADRRTPGPTP